MRATVMHAAGDVRLEDTLSDVMGTGHHAAVVAGVKPGEAAVESALELRVMVTR